MQPDPKDILKYFDAVLEEKTVLLLCVMITGKMASLLPRFRVKYPPISKTSPYSYRSAWMGS